MIISFFGARRSGKSTLIKSIFPMLEVDFDEAVPLRNYVYRDIVVREFSGKRTDLEFLKLKEDWKIDIAVLVLDPKNPDSLQTLRDSENMWKGASEKIVVVTKSKEASEEFLRESEKYAREIGGTLFAVDLEDEASLSRLKKHVEEVIETSRRAQPKTEKTPRRVEERESRRERPAVEEKVVLVRSLAPVAYEEFIVMARKSLEEFTPAVQGLDEVDLQILSMSDGYTSVEKMASRIGVDRREVEDRVKRLKEKGYIREIKTIFTRKY